MKGRWPVLVVGLLVLGLAGAAACGGDGDDGGNGGTEVNVTLA